MGPGDRASTSGFKAAAGPSAWVISLGDRADDDPRGPADRMVAAPSPLAAEEAEPAVAPSILAQDESQPLRSDRYRRK